MVILGVSNDAPAANAAFRSKFDFPFDLLSDVNNTLALAYGAVDSADADRHSRISYIIGPDGRVVKAYPKVAAAEHPEQVLADLR